MPRPIVGVSGYEVMSGVMLMSLLLVTVVAQLRDRPYKVRLPFIVGTIALGGLFRGVDAGNTGLFWFALLITTVLAPSVPEAIRRTPSA